MMEDRPDNLRNRKPLPGCINMWSKLSNYKETLSKWIIDIDNFIQLEIETIQEPNTQGDVLKKILNFLDNFNQISN